MTFRLSQSAIKAYRAESNPDGCMLRFKLTYIDHIKPDDDGEWSALKKGILFERLVLGQSRDHDELIIPKLKSGFPDQVERDITALAEQVKSMITQLCRVDATQIKLQTPTRQGHPDAEVLIEGRKAILDLKYTDTKADDRYRGWGEVGTMDHTQALDYVDLYHEVHGEWLPFYYLVCGKGGWVRLIKINIRQDSLAHHQQAVDTLYREITSRKEWPSSESFLTCQSCELASKCTKAVKLPRVEQFEV